MDLLHPHKKHPRIWPAVVLVGGVIFAMWSLLFPAQLRGLRASGGLLGSADKATKGAKDISASIAEFRAQLDALRAAADAQASAKAAPTIDITSLAEKLKRATATPTSAAVVAPNISLPSAQSSLPAAAPKKNQ